jgi:aspartyl-tRNA(Asn)/glutamyl-tRNA(Gln) amidotransferase subunit A
MTSDICFLTIEQVGAELRRGELTATSLVEAFIERHERIGPQLNCYATFLAERARRQAQALDELLAVGVDLGPLHGIPIAVKDNVDTRGIPSTNGSPIYRDRVPTDDSTVIARLHAAGAIVLGKANLYEWAYGSPSALFGDVSNPWDLACTAGASSNGSAAAVAAGLATAAIGTDLGGSIRIPAAMCGIYGLKPTYGLVSRHGVLPHGQTLDHVGPMTHTAADAQLMLDAIAGPDPKDPVSLAEQAGSFAHPADLRGLRIGLARPQAGHEASSDVLKVLDQAVTALTELGCIVIDVDLPSLDDARAAMWTISAVEGAEFHLPILREANEQYSDKARRLLLGGALISGIDYARCQRVRKVLANQVGALFDQVAVVLSPVLRSPAWDASLPVVDFGDGPEDNMSAMTHYSPLFNLTGHPAATFLGGFAVTGMPVGLQMAAPLYGEEVLTAVVSAFEAATGYSERRPQLA